MSKIQDEIRSAIKNRLTDKKLTNKKLCEACDFSTTSFSLYLHKKRDIPIEVAERMAEYLGIEITVDGNEI
jgi:transcriptional regulator with XRE-family HTH domain